jgi:hypothetical protein
VTAGGLAQNGLATFASNDGLRVGEDSGDFEAAVATNVHEEAVRTLDETLQLVLLGLKFGVRVQKVELHDRWLLVRAKSQLDVPFFDLLLYHLSIIRLSVLL